MVYTSAQKLQALGVDTQLALTLQSQIAAGTGVARPLIELGFVPKLANYVAASITSSAFDAVEACKHSLNTVTAPLLEQLINASKVTTAPAITGTAQVGQTLTRVAGAYSGTPTPTVTWVWTADGVNIAGTENDATYVPVIGDIGAVIRVVDTATNVNGTVTSTSAPTAAVIAA